MLMKNEEKWITWLVIFSGVVASLIITPNISLDPINLPKMLTITISGFAMLGIIFLNIKNLIKVNHKGFLLVILLFVLQLFNSILFSGSPFNQQFFGTNGRNTGLLTYFSFVLLAVGTSIISNKEFSQRILISLMVVGGTTSLYGILQTLGLDPIKWNNPYNSVIGFVGNPNFASSLMGMGAVALFSFVLNKKGRKEYRFIGILFIVIALVLISRSRSIQGFLVFGAGAVIVFFIFLLSLRNRFRKWLLIIFTLIASCMGTISIFGMLNLGPLSGFLYKASVRQRGFYWNAAIEMMKSYPFFGVGLDSYGDWYFQKRSLNAATVSPDTQSNAAHNVFLEIGAVGGVPLLILYLILCLIAFYCAFTFLRRNRNFNWVFAGIFGSWVAYLAQSIVSLNQIGIAIWGWILMGAIIGLEVNSRPKDLVDLKESKFKPGRSVRTNSKKSKALPGVLIGILVGLAAALPPFISDVNFRTAVFTRNAEKIISASLNKPEDPDRTFQAAQLLANSKLNPQAISMVKRILEINPRHYNAWKLYFNLSTPGTTENLKASEMLKKLNPNLPTK
jgi:O-antigen ligase